MGITTAEFVTWLETFADRIHDARDELTALDSAIGDADHGINMDRGMTAVREHLPTLRDGQAGALFKQVGRTLISTVGGASGPLYGTRPRMSPRAISPGVSGQGSTGSSASARRISTTRPWSTR